MMVVDDGYGIFVFWEVQMIKDSISEVMVGMEVLLGINGIGIYKVKGWDYLVLCEVYE